MLGLVVMVEMTLSGHLSNINEIFHIIWWLHRYVKALMSFLSFNFSQFLHITDVCIGPNNLYLKGTCYYVENTRLSIGEAIAKCQETLSNGRLFEPRDETTHNSVLAAALEISSTSSYQLSRFISRASKS
jgi:hypothetical protein